MSTPNTWYANTGNTYQGLVIDEVTGKSIAITYGIEHTKLVAAAPELLAALENLIESIPMLEKPAYKEPIKAARAAIAKATA